MAITIVPAKIEDAEAIIEYMQHIVQESENLTFGSGEFIITVEAESKMIGEIVESANSTMLLAKLDGQIVGSCNISGRVRRLSHIGDLGMSVAKKYWGQGIGSMLLEEALRISQEQLKLEVISLEVRADNHAAIHLYEKFGFQRIGTFEKLMKIKDQYFAGELMNLYF